MKRAVALSILVVLIFISAFGVWHSFSLGHMAHMDGCVFTFGASPECITSIVGSLMRSDDVLLTMSLLLFFMSIALIGSLLPRTLILFPTQSLHSPASPPSPYAHNVYTQALARGIINSKKYA